jgi:predicted RNA binding protein YcfA (HicA-like mRNA interferase family)
MERNSRKLIKLLEEDGWRLVAIAGSHHQFEHPTKPGKLAVPHPKKARPIGTARQILKFAGLLDQRK